MSWTCPNCNRKFHTERKYHSCDVISLEDHLQKVSPAIRELTEDILTFVRKWKGTQVNPLKSTILVTAGTNFLSLKPRKNSIDIEFILEEEVNEFPVYKIISYGKIKRVHFVKIDSQEDFNSQLKRWIQAAYQISSRKPS